MAKYFNYFPQTIYSPQNAGEGYSVDYITNITSRFGFEASFKENTSVYYKYDIQDSDTPEIIADKYYGDPYKYWIVLYSNNLLDPIWDWPMQYNQLMSYLDSKYKAAAEDAGLTPFEYMQLTVYSYEKVTQTIDKSTDAVTTIYQKITEDDYTTLIPTTNTYRPDGIYDVVVDISKRIVSIYDYETELNERKRQIKVMNVSYVAEMEKRFQELMGV
jgi:hypothetical protein